MCLTKLDNVIWGQKTKILKQKTYDSTKGHWESLIELKSCTKITLKPFDYESSSDKNS